MKKELVDEFFWELFKWLSPTYSGLVSIRYYIMWAIVSVIGWFSGDIRIFAIISLGYLIMGVILSLWVSWGCEE